MKTSTTAAQVCDTIMQQIGGNKFLTMTGSKPQCYGTSDAGNDFITLQLAKNGVGAKWLKITSMPNDTYSMEFSGIKNGDISVISHEDNVYCDMLQSTFTDITGLYTTLVSL